MLECGHFAGTLVLYIFCAYLWVGGGGLRVVEIDNTMKLNLKTNAWCFVIDHLRPPYIKWWKCSFGDWLWNVTVNYLIIVIQSYCLNYGHNALAFIRISNIFKMEGTIVGIVITATIIAHPQMLWRIFLSDCSVALFHQMENQLKWIDVVCIVGLFHRRQLSITWIKSNSITFDEFHCVACMRTSI